MNQLTSELTRVADRTTYNGTPLLDGTYADQPFQVGARTGETIVVTIADIAGAVTPAVSDAEGTPASGRSVLNGDYSSVGASATYT